MSDTVFLDYSIAELTVIDRICSKGASNPGCAHKGARTTLPTTYSNLTMAPKMAKVPPLLRIKDVSDLN